SQSGTKLRLASLQDRVALSESRLVGLAASPNAPCSADPSTYLLTDSFNAVRPSPDRSYATPIRGVTSFQFTKFCRAKLTFRVGVSGAGPSDCAGKYLFSRSKRAPRLSVS